MEQGNQAAARNDVELMDHIARLTLADNEAVRQLRAAYEDDPRLRMPSDWQP